MKISLQTEQDLANKIIDLEKELYGLLEKVDGWKHKIIYLKSRPRKNNAETIEKVDAMIGELHARSSTETQLKTIVSQAKKLQRRAEELRWELAMSAEHITKIEANKMTNRHMPVEDLMQEGLVGLLEAAKRYDPTKGIRFTTYARWWVRAQITRCIENTGRLIRIPGGAIEQTRNIQTIIDQCTNEGLEINVTEIASGLGISKKRANMLLAQQGTISLDAEDNEGNSLMETVASNTDSADTEFELQEALDVIQTKFSDLLDHREQFILTHHFGLDGQPKQTMKEIGAQISLSKERVRQIESKAIDRLRTLFL